MRAWLTTLVNDPRTERVTMALIVVNAVILGQEFGATKQATFDDDLQKSKRITLEQWKNRPLLMRLKELGASIWARWL